MTVVLWLFFEGNVLDVMRESEQVVVWAVDGINEGCTRL
jgi:hypothetical protein